MLTLVETVGLISSSFNTLCPSEDKMSPDDCWKSIKKKSRDGCMEKKSCLIAEKYKEKQQNHDQKEKRKEAIVEAKEESLKIRDLNPFFKLYIMYYYFLLFFSACETR